MANDPNQSNKRPPNTLDSDSGFNDIERIGRRSSKRSIEDVVERQRINSARETVEGLEDLIASNPSAGEFDIISKGLKDARETRNRLGPRIRMRQEARRERALEETQNAIQRNFSSRSINGQVIDLAGSESVQGRAMGMISMSPRDLERARGDIMSQVGQLEQNSLDIAQGMYDAQGRQDPNALASLRANYRKKNTAVGRLSVITAAERHQRGLGLDPESQIEDLLSKGRHAEKITFRNKVADELASGTGDVGGRSIDQLKQREAQLASQLVEELTKLKESAGKSTEELDKMRESASATAENLKKTEEAISQMGSGGGGGNRFGSAANALNFASSTFGAVGMGVQQIAVNQRLGQTQNVSGYASIENQKYQTYRSASGGDIASQLMLGQFGGAEGFGRELRAGANLAVGAQIAGGVTQIAAGGVRVASTMNPAENMISTSSAMNNRLQGAQDILQGGATTAIAGADMFRDISGSQASIAGVNAQLEARRQLMMVNASQLQGFRDFSVGVGSAAIGMGSRGAAFVQRMISKENLGQMTNARISPEQMSQMAEMGVQNIGSTFNESQIFGARGLERSGFGSVSENMQRMSTLAGAGSNNPQSGLGSVMEAAFSKSLEGSKVLNMMVQNTGNMVQMSAGRAMGIDTTAASAQILAAGVNTADPNQEYAMQRAASAAERMRMIGTDTGTNFAAMSATARISKMTGLGGTEAIIAQQLDDATLRSMKNLNPNEIRTKMFDRGIDVKEGQERQLVDQLIKARLITNLQGGGAGLATGVDAAAIADKISSGKALNKVEQIAYNQAATLGGFGGGVEAQRAATALISEDPNSVTKTKVTNAFRGEGGSEQQKTLDDMRTQGFKQLSQAALEATASFKTAADALKALGQLAKNVENIGDEGGEGRFKTAAADAAGSFGKSTMTFKSSVEDFSKAVNAMVSRSGLNGIDRTSELLKNLDNNTNKRGLGPGQ